MKSPDEETNRSSLLTLRDANFYVIIDSDRRDIILCCALIRDVVVCVVKR